MPVTISAHSGSVVGSNISNSENVPAFDPGVTGTSPMLLGYISTFVLNAGDSLVNCTHKNPVNHGNRGILHISNRPYVPVTAP